jgi:succinyl-CoA synthetase alpha subunit
MAILIDRPTRVLIQGMTGKTGSFQASIMKDYGTNIVAGVTPGRGGTEVFGIPVFDSVEEAVSHGQADAAISFVPARFAKDAALEVIRVGIRFLVVTAEGIPVNDVVDILRYAEACGTRVLGPDTPGLISPGRSKLGVHPHVLFAEGHVGILSKSGSLSYEVGRVLTAAGIGQTTVVGIGGGPLWGLTQEAVLNLFEKDADTHAVVLLGEVGGAMEHQAARFIAARMSKPVVALVVGRTAPRGARMGHAGAIIEGNEGTAEAKCEALRQAGAHIATDSLEIPHILKRLGV